MNLYTRAKSFKLLKQPPSPPHTTKHQLHFSRWAKKIQGGGLQRIRVTSLVIQGRGWEVGGKEQKFYVTIILERNPSKK